MERIVRGMAMLVLAVLAGCGGSGDPAGTVVPASIAQQAPPSCSYEHVYVTARSVRVHVQGGAGEAWHDISLPAPRRIDLMHLGAGVFDALRMAPLPAGRYLELRLVLDADPAGHAVQPSGGVPIALSVPAGGTSGLKFQGDFQVAAWQSADVQPDGFDACTSVIKAGNSGTYQLTPQIQARAVATPAGRETRTAGNAILSLPGGGVGALRNDGAAAILQRLEPQGAYAGAELRFPLASSLAALAPLRGGNYVLASYLDPVDGPGLPVQPLRFFMQPYDGTGTPMGSLQQLGFAYPIAISHTFPGTAPTIAALAGGGFVILWGDLCCRFMVSSADGNSVGAPRMLDLQSPAQVIALASGGFMAVAGLQSVVAVPFAADGAQLGTPQVVGATQWTPPSSWTGVAASPLAAGGAVVVWATETTSSAQRPALQVRRVANDGVPVGDPFALGPVDFGPTSVAGLDDGGFVVAWRSDGHVVARRFAPDGTATSDATRLDAFTTSVQEVSVVSTGAGGFLVSWIGTGADGQPARYGRLFDAGGLLPG